MLRKSEEKITNIVERSNKPVSIQKIAKELDISWGTARANLFSLALEGEINGIRTDKGWIFFKGNLKLRG